MSARRSSASSGSSAAASSSAAAASAASAAPARARGRSTHSSEAATSTSSNGHARVIAPATPASAATSLSGHKRPATASAGSSSSAAAASASSATPSSDQPASSASQAKKQRGESSSKQRNGSSAAAAATASSVGIDPLPAPPRRSAASSAASAASSRAAAQPSSGSDASSDADKSDESEDESDEEQEWKSAVAASACASASTAPKPHGLFREAKELILGALPFADSQPSDDDHGKTLLGHVRQSLQEPASAQTLTKLSDLCYVMSCHYPQLPSEQTVLRDWLLKVDAMFVNLASSLPELKRREGVDILSSALLAGALQAVPVLVQCIGCFPSFFINWMPMLMWYCSAPEEHVVSLQPYLCLFEFGLDPTETDGAASPLSALQLARNFVRDHAAPPAPAVSGPLATMQAAVAKAESQSIPSIVFAKAIQQRNPSEAAEDQRRDALHAQFMHALISAWRAHSVQVRSLLLAAPTRLIPPLVDVVSRYWTWRAWRRSDRRRWRRRLRWINIVGSAEQSALRRLFGHSAIDVAVHRIMRRPRLISPLQLAAPS